MPTIALLNQAGEKLQDLVLNEEIFGIEPNRQVIYDVVNAQRAAMRQGTHDVKTRSEVSGGGKKPWRQKGTGRARQGSIRAPQWRGGGVAFGPTPRSYAFKLNKKVKRLGLKSALSYKVQEEKFIAVNAVSFEEIKTKNFVQFLKNVNAQGKTLMVCTTEEYTPSVVLSSANIPGTIVLTVNSASVYDILCYDKVIATEAAIKYYEEVLN